MNTLEHQMTSLPSNVDAERSVLGAILMNPKAFDESASLGTMADDFSLDSHRKIYSRMEELAYKGAAIDLVTVISLLSDRKELASVGDAGYVSSLIEGLPDRPNIKTYLRIVKEKAAQRKVIHSCNAVLGGIADEMTSGDAMEYLTDQILQIQTGTDDAPAERVISFSEPVYREWEHLANCDGTVIGISTSLDSLDFATTGIRKGEFWLVGGRTGDGKTALALQIAAANCRHGIPVGFFSIEMAKSDLLQRLWSHEGRIPFQRIRYPRNLDSDTRRRVQSAMCDVGKWPLFVVEDGSLSIQKLLAKARLLIRQEKFELLIVDYVQLISAPAREEKERLTKVSNALRSLAKDTGVPIVAISQLSRPKDGNQNFRPNKFAMRESGTLENDAHVIILTYRPVDEYGTPTGEDELIIAKQQRSRLFGTFGRLYPLDQLLRTAAPGGIAEGPRSCAQSSATLAYAAPGRLAICGLNAQNPSTAVIERDADDHANPPIGLTFHDDPSDDVPHQRGEGWAAISNMSCSWGERHRWHSLGTARLGRVEWLPNFVKSVNSLTPVVSAIMTIKASALRRSTLKKKRVLQGTAALL